jgi:hypothetical protein
MRTKKEVDSFFKKNRKGQGLSTNAIILIVLGIVVLVVLIAGFMLGWGQLKDKIASSNNVKAVVTSCSIACSTDDIYEFCSLKRSLKAEDLPSGGKEVMGTCNEFANGNKNPKYAMYGIQECPALESEEACSDENVKNLLSE